MLAAFCACAVAQGQDSPSPATATPASPGAAVAGVVSNSGAAQTPDSSKPLRVGGNAQSAKITHMVQPVYPQIAKTAHVTGTVVLRVLLDTDGTVNQVTYISGPPLLMKSAIDAVRQWVYQPTVLNGAPVRVDTVVSVVFTLGSDPAGAPPQSASSGDNSQSSAQQQSKSANDAASSPAAIDPEFRADILHLLEVTHSKERAEDTLRKVFESMRPMLVKSLPPTPNRDKIIETYGDKFSAILKSKEFEDNMVKLYAEHLTPADVKTAIKFYETPEGQHYLEGTQNMMSELMDLGQRIAAKNLPAILTDLCKQYPELQGEAKFCPRPTPRRRANCDCPRR